MSVGFSLRLWYGWLVRIGVCFCSQGVRVGSVVGFFWLVGPVCGLVRMGMISGVWGCLVRMCVFVLGFFGLVVLCKSDFLICCVFGAGRVRSIEVFWGCLFGGASRCGFVGSGFEVGVDFYNLGVRGGCVGCAFLLS